MAEAFGMEVGDIPEGAMPYAIHCVVMAMLEDGTSQMFIRSSEGMTQEVTLGILLPITDRLRAEMAGDWDDTN